MSQLKTTVYTMPAADLGKANPLPDLATVSDAHAAIEIDHETVTPEEARYMGWGRVHTILPYLMQDGYNRTRRPQDFKAFVLENEYLRATFLPTLGGRLWSLFDKVEEKELLHCNPVFQPANLALRNAWFSGGVEWNCGIIGHTPFTCSDLCAEALSLSDGTPVLRMFQYERVRRLVYRVEAFLPDGSHELYVRVRIDNPMQEPTAVYWWSNMAVNEGEDIRVVVPAQKAYRYGYGGKLSKVPIPYMTAEADKLRGQAAELARKSGGTLDWDVSRRVCLPQSMDFFFDLPKKARPFIAALNRDGYGICQTSTPELRGRKLFVWGMGQGGRHWQEFLSNGDSAYIELQSGLARTQLEHLPMQPGQTISWLESYGPLKTDGCIVQGADWSEAVRHTLDRLEAFRPEQVLEDYHQKVRQELDGQTGTVLHRAVCYALNEMSISCGNLEGLHLNQDAMCTDAFSERFLASSAFPASAPLSEPKGYVTGSEWEAFLREKIRDGSGDHWEGHYLLGVLLDADQRSTEAEDEYRISLEKASNPWALRCLALHEKKRGQLRKGADLLLEAARMKPIRPLVLEAMQSLLEIGSYDELLRLYQAVPEFLREDGRILTLRAAALLRSGDLDGCEQILQGNIVLTDIREGNTLLTDLFFELAAMRQFGRVSEDALVWAKQHVTPPQHLDFRML